ncbi:hypothetical protein H6G82_27820 [Planktothricoides sp. FACHB-1261]|nr:hypothetical protein [Planktothricoides raciborskii FACHB-1261]
MRCPVLDRQIFPKKNSRHGDRPSGQPKNSLKRSPKAPRTIVEFWLLW